MSQDFAGRVALVTGAAGGIGRASAVAFATRGADVAVADVTDVGETVGLLRDLGVDALPLAMDVSDRDSVKDAVEATISAFGRLDFAHNNAGIHAIAPAAELGEDDWDRVVAVNLTGVFLCMKYELPHVLAAGGAIVNTASVWSSLAASAQTAYVATKHGVAGLTRAAALDYGRQGIRVNAVAPGPVATRMTAGVPEEFLTPIVERTTFGRIGQPPEIGEAVAWLCSSEASFVNGAILPVDGGYSVT